MMKSKTIISYRLTEAGRNLLYLEWLRLGGCGLPNDSLAPVKLGPVAHWRGDTVLGLIADACQYTERTLARFAVEHLNRTDLAEAVEL